MSDPTEPMATVSGAATSSVVTDPRSPDRSDRGPWWLVAGPLALAAVIAVANIAVAQGYVLDDWFLVRGVSQGGAWSVVESDLLAARPGSLVAYVLPFGLAPENAGVTAAVQAGYFVVAALLALLVARRLTTPLVAAAIVTVWVVLPNHLTLEIWPSATVATVSLALLLGGVLLLLRERFSPLALLCACLLMAWSCLTYEASLVPAALAFVWAPWRVSGRLRWTPVLAGAATLSAVVAWQLLHWHSVKRVQQDLEGYTQIGQAHFGWGVAPDGLVASMLLLVAVLGVTVALARLLLPSFRPAAGPAERLVAFGLVVMVVGSVAFAAYFYAPLGAGDRVNYVSALGGAAVWVGVAWMATRVWRPAGAILLGVLLTAGVAARWERTQLWATAKADAERIVEVVRAVDPSCTTVTLGPAPIQERNVAAFLDQSNVDAAVQVALGRVEVRGAITFDEERFLASPEECRIDIRSLSDLEADVTVAPT